MNVGRRGSHIALTGAGIAGVAVILALALSGGFRWPAEAPARAAAQPQCGTSENLAEWTFAVVTLAPDSGPPGTSLEVGLTGFAPNSEEEQPIEIVWNWDPDAGEGALIGSSTIPVNETSVTVDAAVPDYAEPGSYPVTACWYRPASDMWFYRSAPFEVTEPTPTPSPTPSPTATPTPTATPAPSEEMHNCPEAGRWAIAVWEGADRTDAEEALDDCGEGAVGAAYALDPGTQSWLRWFADHPQFNTLDELSDWQGVIAHGKAEPGPAPEPEPSEANEMHNCPEAGQWTIAAWEGADDTDTDEAFGDCDEDVDAAYALDADTQNWLRWFPGKPEVSNLRTLKDKMGIIAHGKATLRPPAQIAFASNRDGDPEIYVMNPDGTAQTRLTYDPLGTDDRPAWSPDRSKIAFESSRDGTFQIYVMNADGSGQTNLSNSPTTDDAHPTWSPDGGKIAFSRAPRIPAGPGLTTNADFEIYVMNADGTGQTNVTNYPAAPDDNPDWSPDGSKIAFESWRDGDWEIYVMNADGSGQTRLTTNPGTDGAPAWSPDGTKIAFTCAKICVMNADGSGRTTVPNAQAADSDPTWSPDGTKIAFGGTTTGDGEIFVMNVDGSGRTNITNCTGPQPSIWFHDVDPAWAP